MDKNNPLCLKKGKPHNARPYDRQNQSILGKVASKVKGLLTPSWLTQWIGAVPDDSSGSDRHEEEQESRNSDLQAVMRMSKRPRLKLDRTPVDPEPYTPPTWSEPGTSNTIFNNVTQPSATQTLSNSLENQPQPALNGDDRSENSEASASTSGCSSLVSSHKDKLNHVSLRLNERALESLYGKLKSKTYSQPSRKDATPYTERNIYSRNTSLWSSGTPSILSPVRSPSVIQSTKPSFNLTTFGGTSKGNMSSNTKISSPFYEGKTAFGGASSTRRMPISVAPYQAEKSLRNQIRIKESRLSGNSECMSSAAKRILQTLEKMSSPITDAKKIPNTSISPVDLSVYLTPPSHHKKPFKPFPTKDSVSTKGPPIANVNTIAKLTTLRNYGLKRAKTSAMEIPFTENKTIVPDQDIENQTSYLQTNYSLNRGGGGGGGKMKSKLNQNLHFSSKENAEKEFGEDIALPNVPLPITKLPTFNLGIITTKAKDSVPKKEKPLLSNDQSSFTFASPIEHPFPKAALPVPKTVSDYNFEFSSPICLDEDNSESVPKVKKNTEKVEESSTELYSCGSVNDFLKILSGNEKEGNSFADAVPIGKPDSKLLKNESSSSLHGKVKGNSGKQEQIAVKNGSDKGISNVGFGSTCGSSVTAENDVKELASDSGSRKCTSCLVRNTSNKDKCLACEMKQTPSLNGSGFNDKKEKSFGVQFGFGDKFKVERGSWSCSTCLIQNKEKDVKCVACETPNPTRQQSNKENAPTGENDKKRKSSGSNGKDTEKVAPKGMLSSFAVKSGAWECDTCLVRNHPDKSKCVACETSRPGSDSSQSLINTGGFKFGSTVQNSPITFKFGSFTGAAQETPATSNFTFGILTSSVKSCNNTPTTSSTDSGIKISEPSIVSSGGFKIDVMNSAQATNFGGFVLNSDSSQGGANEKKAIQTTSGMSKKEESSKATSVTKASVNSDCNVLSKPSSCLTDVAVDAPISSGGFKNIGNSSGTLMTFSLPNSPLPTNTIGNKTDAPAVGKFLASVPSSQTATKISEGFQFGDKEDKPVPVFCSSVLSDVSKSSEKAVSLEKVTGVSTTQDVSISDAPKNSFNFLAPLPVASTKPVTAFSLPASSESSLFKFMDNNPAKASSGTTSETTVFSSASSFGAISSIPNFAFSNSPTKTLTSISSTNSSGVPSSVGSVQFQNSLQLPSVTAPFTAATTTSSFTFGNQAVATPASNLPGFSFFTSSTTTNPSSKTSGIFSFGASSNTTDALKSGGFTFKGQTEEKPNPMTAGSLNYQPFKQDATNVSVPNSTSAAAVAPTAATSTLFKFGATAPTSTGGFIFGAPKTEPQPSTATPFAFGSSPATSGNTSTFPGFQQNQAAAPVAAPGFQFGSNVPGSSVAPPAFGTPANAFTFGSKSNEPASQMSVPSVQNPAPPFGCPQMQPIFGGASATATFGKTLEDKTPTSGFNFGQSVVQSSVFRFGASADKKAAVAAAPSSGFSFGGVATPEAPNSFPSGFSMNTPPSFNFGATSTPAGPFQFAASNESRASPQNLAPRRYRKAVRRGLRKE